MSEFNIHIWVDQYDDLQSEILKRNPKVVNFLALEEFDFFLDFDYQSFFSQNNIRANFYLGIAEINDEVYNPAKNCYLYLDPLFQFRRSFRSYNLRLYDNIYEPFKHKIMCLMFRTRDHRCMLMDNLEKRNLVNNNAISFRKTGTTAYKFQHWFSNNCVILNSESLVFSNSKQWAIPGEWHSSYLHIISETCVDRIYITEKTCAPLLGAKLFICQAAKGFHQKLRDLGFLLYDEIIDYRFDSIKDDSNRLEAMLDQVEQVINYTDYNNVYKKLNQKLKYNQKHAITLALSDPPNHIPQHILDYYNKNVGVYY